MQCCQHCGAKSWAAVMATSGDAAILVCDGCGQTGLKSVIESNPQPIEIPPPMFSGIPPFAIDIFKSLLTPCETRLERLVKAILSSSLTSGEVRDQEYNARWWVSLARAIEKEMDREELLSKAPPSPIPDAQFAP